MGVLVGLPCLKLAGPYVALVTFGVHMALQPLLRGEIGIAIGSGGSVGILTIPPIHFRVHLQFRQPGAHLLPDPPADLPLRRW
jgi:ABC-type branched-subunit amino acid transport system permease subunit